MTKKSAQRGRNSGQKDGAKSEPKAQSLKPEAPADSAPPPLTTWRTVNRVQLAELMGVHPDTVTDNTKLGMPVVTVGGRGKESEYDAVACLAWQRAREGRDALKNAQTSLYKANTQKAELDLDLKRGLLVKRDEVILAGQAFVKAWSAKLLTMPPRLRNIGAITREQEAGVAAFVREMLTEISTWKTVGDAMDAATKDSAA